jgi:hypothetical protein
LKVDLQKYARTWPEYGLAGLVMVGLAGVLIFFVRYGYLPSPFYHLKNDTFMDWYNPAYWSHHAWIYTQAKSFYPPLAFDLLRWLTPADCYRGSALIGRRCDVSGYVVLSLSLLADFALALAVFRQASTETATPRAIALTLSASMLYGWERGNLVLPCFAVFVLAYGPLVRAPWLRAVLAAVAVNLKPYLLVTPYTQALRQDWPEVWRFVAASAVVYVASFILLGQGTPWDIVRDGWMFMRAPADLKYGIFQFTTTYNSLLQVLANSAPLRSYLGSNVVSAARVLLPVAMALGAGGAFLCLGLAVLRRDVLSPNRMAALGFSILFVFASPGAYALIFLLLFVFLEPWRGAGRIVALIAAYLWCVPWDFNLAPLLHETNFSFLAGRPVGFELSLTLGELLRPGLVLAMQAGLVLASLGEFRQARARQAHLPNPGR